MLLKPLVALAKVKQNVHPYVVYLSFQKSSHDFYRPDLKVVWTLQLFIYHLNMREVRLYQECASSRYHDMLMDR